MAHEIAGLRLWVFMWQLIVIVGRRDGSGAPRLVFHPFPPVGAPQRKWDDPAMIDDHLTFKPSEDARQWLYDTFVEPGAPLYNEDHGHLLSASLGFVWTNVEAKRKGRMIIGQAEQPGGGGNPWSKGRAELQLETWFGEVPDFLITIYWPWWRDASEPQRCALVEHELYHCAQEKDEFGSPRFSKTTGAPVFGIAPHDVEEFVGVVRRYGVVSDDVRALVDAAGRDPEFSGESVSSLCGVCL